MTMRSILVKGLKRGIRALERSVPQDKQRIIEGAICYHNENVTVGKDVSFGGNVILYGTAPIEIGNDTMIGADVYIHTSTHDYTNHPTWLERIDRPVKIGKHVWIGFRAIILPGVIIGDYAVIGAGSVVAAHVPDRAIVAGNPARIIKYRDSEGLKPDCHECYSDSGRVITESFLPKHKQCKPVEKNDNA